MQSIDKAYVDGISITLGSPHKHVSGTTEGAIHVRFYTSDPLWDGQCCPIDNGCYAQIGMPKFYRKTLEPSNENTEVHICKSERHSNEDVAIEELNIFVL